MDLRRTLCRLGILCSFYLSPAFADGPLEPVSMQGQCLQAGVFQKSNQTSEHKEWLSQWPSSRRGYLVTLTDCDQHPQQDWTHDDGQLSGIKGELAVMSFGQHVVPVVRSGRSFFRTRPLKLQQGRLVFMDKHDRPRCLMAKKRFRFTHAPLEQCKSDPELQAQSRWLFAMPPEPGEEGLVGLAGIDADQDGVRDDVQRLIAQTLQDEPAEVVEAINKMATLKQKELTHAYDEQYILDLLPEYLAAIRCYIYRTNSDPHRYGKRINAQFYNTIERLKALNKVNSYYGGMVITTPEDREAQCHFKP